MGESDSARTERELRALRGQIDTDISLSTKHGTSGYFGAPPGFVAETSERWLATYRGRVAYVAESWMIYLTGSAPRGRHGILIGRT